MSKFYSLMLTLVILVLIAFMLGWFQISSSTDEKHEKINVNLSVDKGKVKEDAATAEAKARELGQKTSDEAKEVARKIGNLASSDQPGWSVDKKSITMEPGEKQDVTLTRSGDLKPMQAGVFPSAGSRLVVSGGLFKEGEKTVRVTIEAPLDARDGTVTIVADGKSEVVTVTVTAKSPAKAL